MSKLAISIQSRGDGLAAPLDPRFGRAARFLLVAGEGPSPALETVNNPAVDASHGAGTGAATLMKDLSVGAVITGRVGPKAFDVLRALGIDAWLAPPGLTAGEALQALREGRLERMALREYR